MKVEIHNPDSPFNGLWLNDVNYVLNKELIPHEVVKATITKVGLKQIGNDIWTPVKGGVSDWSWDELVNLSLKILHGEMTRLVCLPMFLDEIPKFEMKKTEAMDLPTHQISNDKKITCSCAWKNWHTDKQEMLPKFRFYAKDTQDPAIGTWLHWIVFATKVLSDQNTYRIAPTVYSKEIQINF